MKEKSTKILNIIMLVFTLMRVYIGTKIPLFIQADAAFDDLLMVRYANNILETGWLGAYEGLTLAKTISYPIYLAANFVLGIPYPIALTLFYVFGTIALSVAVGKLIRNKYAISVLYIFLLYSPVMFHQENIQKVYRGGCLVAASMTVIAAFVGMFAQREDSRKMVPWSIIGIIMLPFFYYLKEDGIWIVPFCIGAVVATVVWLLVEKNKKDLIKKTVLVLAPILMLGLVTLGYKTINYVHYGVFATTDRADAAFSDFMGDLVRIDAGADNEEVWVTREAINMALDASPTFSIFRDDINEVYDSGAWYIWWDGEIHGDYYIWCLRDIVKADALAQESQPESANMMLTEHSAQISEDIYREIHYELTNAFKSGTLPKKRGLYLSKVAQGINAENRYYFGDTFKECLMSLVKYSENKTSIEYATGDSNAVQIMSELTMSPAIMQGTSMNAERAINLKFVRLIEIIVSAYSVLGLPILIVSILGLVALTVMTIVNLVRGDNHYLEVCLVSLGLLISFAALFVGVQWFTRFLGAGKKFYDYMCCGMIIMQILEFLGIWSLWELGISMKTRKSKGDRG